MWTINWNKDIFNDIFVLGLKQNDYSVLYCDVQFDRYMPTIRKNMATTFSEETSSTETSEFIGQTTRRHIKKGNYINRL
jgi:hypothetical protein